MTSEATHDATREWFEQHNWFGLNAADVYLFRQGSVPTFDAKNGKLLMSSHSSLALSPDGHGGLITAMSKHGLFEVLADHGIETLFYHQVDNPLVRVCDPAFLGWHLQGQGDVSIKYVAKRIPEECVGNIVEIDGRLRMIEYTDLTQELACCRDADGQLKLRAGNTGIHCFQRRFLERLALQGKSLPWHSVQRKVPFINSMGMLVQPDHPNALKYEQFIFDVLAFSENVQLVETLREQEFAPLKNAEGEGSVKAVQRAMMNAKIA
jgi:UDP-N-acetylglucosamine/UDP-N-acetylgalactosamine diphosphorylase